MDSINETVIFPDRPLFLTHRKRPGNPATVDLSTANLNGFLPESSKSEAAPSNFNIESRPSGAEGAGSLARYRKIKFIDNNVAEITKRRSARPRQLKAKRLRIHPESSKPGSSSKTMIPSPGSTSLPSNPSSSDDYAGRNLPPPQSSEVIARAMQAMPLALVATPRSAISMLSDGLAQSIKFLMPELISYYLTTLCTAVYPLSSAQMFNPMCNYWFPMAVTDELLFITSLFACTAHMIQVGRGYVQENAELLHRVVRLLNQRIIDAGDSGNYSDATICSVSCLALTEAVLGNWDKWQLHIQGMKRMIAFKGGIKSVVQPLHLKVHRADIEGAVESGLLPVLEAPESLELPLGLPTPRQPIDPVAAAAKPSVLAPCKYDPVVEKALNEVINMSSGISVALREGIPSIHPLVLDQRVMALQYQLLDAPFEAYKTLDNAARFATLIYLKTFCRERELRWMSVRLAERLEAAIKFMMPIGFPVPLLCWICFMGMFGSVPRSERWKFFAMNLLQWYRSRKGREPTFEDIKDQLMQLAWIPEYHDEEALQQWQLLEEIVISGGEMRPLKYVTDVFFVLEE